MTPIQLSEKLQEAENKLVKLTRRLQTSSAGEGDLKTRILEIQNAIQTLTQTQETLQRRITTLNERIQQIPRRELHMTMTQIEELPLAKLTETEREVLTMLVKEGPMTAPKVEKKIGKTREHTARLMKKLWQEGYVERDTHRMPFTYRCTKKLKKILKKKSEEKKAEEIVSTISEE
jgi:predicted transcriptional regulator